MSADGVQPPTASWVPQPTSPADGADFVAASGSTSGGERPELAVGAAFAGGLLAALILKRLAR